MYSINVNSKITLIHTESMTKAHYIENVFEFYFAQGDSTPGEQSPEKMRPVNSLIKKENAAIKALKESEDEIPDANILEHWYELDENSNPPVFRLQNIRYIILYIEKIQCSISIAPLQMEANLQLESVHRAQTPSQYIFQVQKLK